MGCVFILGELSGRESKAIAFLTEHADQDTVVSFSGGKDSLVALDLASRVGIRDVVFSDTSIEFEETVSYVRTIADLYGFRNPVYAELGSNVLKKEFQDPHIRPGELKPSLHFIIAYPRHNKHQGGQSDAEPVLCQRKKQRQRRRLFLCGVSEEGEIPVRQE